MSTIYIAWIYAPSIELPCLAKIDLKSLFMLFPLSNSLTYFTPMMEFAITIFSNNCLTYVPQTFSLIIFRFVIHQKL
jgi:hypothetical protein